MRRRLLRGFYETAERDLVKSFIAPGDHVLELGGSIGIVTSFLCRQTGPSGRVVSVEADSALQPYFAAQLALNDLRAEWVNALCCPIWAEEVPTGVREQSFQPSAENLSGHATARKEPGGPRWLTAAQVCRQTKLEPTALMVDVEGSEAAWVEHPPRMPASVRTVIAEFHPKLSGTRLAGQAIQRILDEGFRVTGLRETVLAFSRK